MRGPAERWLLFPAAMTRRPALILLCAFVLACGGHLGAPSAAAGDASDDGAGGYGSIASLGSPLPPQDATVAAGGASADAQDPGEAATGPPFDAGPDGVCEQPLAPGDLVIDELMIASKSGGGDHAEWVEAMSTRDCALNLKGLYAEVPHGKSTTLASITTDLMLPPHGFLLIADSSDPTLNNALPGTVVTWGTGTSADVLLNSGDTITLYTAKVTVDTLTYPNPTKMIEGASMAFPSDCDPSLRTAFGNWQPSVASWTPGYFGTPSGPNDDVSCAVGPPPPASPPSVSPCGG